MLLAQACRVEPIAAGIVWLLDEHQRLRGLCEHQLQSLSPDGRFVISPAHQQQLARVLQEGQPVCMPLEPSEPALAHGFIALGPLARGSQAVGVLELFTRGTLPDDAQVVLRRAVEDLCEFGSELLTAEPAVEENPLQFWEQFDRFTLNLQRSLDTDEVAAVAVNDGLVLLGCDRLSVALRRGARTVVRAISGQDKVDQRSNLVRAMSALADQAMQTGDVITYRGVTDGLTPQVGKPLSDYVLESRCRMAMLVPLRESVRISNSDDEPSARQRPRPQPVIGCLIVEQMTDSKPRLSVTRHVDIVADHAAAAQKNARAHSEFFILSNWRRVRRGVSW